MKKLKTMLVGSVLVASALSSATGIDYDLGLGFESSSVAGKASQSTNNPGMMFGAPRMDLSVSRAINGPVSAFARFSGTSGSAATGFMPEVELQCGRELQAMAGFSYDYENAVYAFAPVVSFANYSVATDSNPEGVNLNGVGINGSVDLKHDRFGVRFFAQYLVNNRFENWADSSISEKVGNLSTNITKVGVSIIGNKQSIA
jgi:hypothetical protein